MNWPTRNPFITQEYGGNKDVYARFGLKGHNGLDLRARTGTRIISPHNGKVVETSFDANGYGNYLKIENDKEGSILAHLQRVVIKVGEEVSEGQLVGYANNTGFSTASHLHWGYYRKPRDRSNGYSGTVDPRPFMKEEEVSDEKDLAWYKREYPIEQQRVIDARKERDDLKEELAVSARICQKQVNLLNNDRTGFFKAISPDKIRPIANFEEAEDLFKSYKTHIEELEKESWFSKLIKQVFNG